MRKGGVGYGLGCRVYRYLLLLDAVRYIRLIEQYHSKIIHMA